MMAGAPAISLSNPGAVVNFSVMNHPDVVVTVGLPGPGGENSTDALAEFSLNGNGVASGSLQAYSDGQTRWVAVSGWYHASDGDFSSTFKAEAVRTNSSDLTSTFLCSQSIDTTGVSPLQFTVAGDMVSGLFVVGEAAACSVGDTWVVGTGQTFTGTAESVTVTVERQFEQRDSGGSLVGVPDNAQISFTATDEDSFSGISQVGSNDGTTYGLQGQPGFGFCVSELSLTTQHGTSFSYTDVVSYTDQIVGDTSTWYNYPGYPPGP